jgi:hypothetical protein
MGSNADGGADDDSEASDQSCRVLRTDDDGAERIGFRLNNRAKKSNGQHLRLDNVMAECDGGFKGDGVWRLLLQMQFAAA